MTRRGALWRLPLAVAGCGFRLRTWDLATAFASARIIADASVDLDRDLGLALAEAGVRLVESRGRRGGDALRAAQRPSTRLRHGNRTRRGS